MRRRHGWPSCMIMQDTAKMLDTARSLRHTSTTTPSPTSSLPVVKHDLKKLVISKQVAEQNQQDPFEVFHKHIQVSMYGDSSLSDATLQGSPLVHLCLIHLSVGQVLQKCWQC